MTLSISQSFQTGLLIEGELSLVLVTTTTLVMSLQSPKMAWVKAESQGWDGEEETEREREPSAY